MAEQLRGIFGILVTPFDKSGEMDVEGLQAQVRFCSQGGAHGIVWPVSSSEFQALSYDERKRGAEAIADEMAKLPASRRLKFVAGTAGLNARDTADLSRHAQSVGADGVVAMPPFAVHVPMSTVPDYYRCIASATTLPLVVQNQSGPMQNAMSAELIVRMAREMPSIQYVKEESGVCTHMITALQRTDRESKALKGVFGGSGGYYLVQEMERGSCGMMSACHVVDAQVKVWDLFEKGDVQGARQALTQTMPLQLLWHLLGIRVPKEVLRVRGVIKNAATRKGDAMDDYDMKEMMACLGQLEPILTVPLPK
ncbi:MAG: dihydrodipicolinate synthase family protein [Chloroflexota bacterium]|nr:dihydrodipicolinate synthase family protein [Chloroflexota bacterium]